MPKKWQLQDAKNRFSELVDEATRNGPQIVTRRGREAAVVISVEDYARLATPAVGLVEFFQTSPLGEVHLDLERAKDEPREVEL